tara:strand:+ start:453 stop:803 length:351 start_codon:yes stop_codon:yes gene_type:complete
MAKKNKEEKKAEITETSDASTDGGDGENQVTLNVGELRGIADIMIRGAANIESLPAEQARQTVLKETWELTQLLIKKEVRECRNNVNQQLLSFFQTFPEALEPIKNQVYPPSDSEE